MGNPEGLIKLKEAIEVALAGNIGVEQVCVNNGEWFDIKIKSLKSDCGDLRDPRWVKLAVPYCVESAEESRADAIWFENDPEFNTPRK